MKQAVVAGEVFSANVGDQAIHQCLIYLLKQLNPALQTVSLDLSGRSGMAARSGGPSLKQTLSLWQGLPGFSALFRQLNRLYQHWQTGSIRSRGWDLILKSADLLVMGGGQILMDDGLGFPLKLSGLARQAQVQQVGYHLTACGVGSVWSAAACSLFGGVLESARSISLRDSASQERLSRYLPQVSSRVTFDPAIWAARVYTFSQRTPTPRRVGLGVINRQEANLPLAPEERFSPSRWMELWLNLLAELADRGLPVELFTTGSLADDTFARSLHTAAAARGLAQVSLAPRPTCPQELLAALPGYGSVIAARLHASILPNACGISTLGLSWDAKVRDYYTDTGRAELCFDLARLRPADAAQACVRLLGQPFPAAELERSKEAAFENARLILQAG